VREWLTAAPGAALRRIPPGPRTALLVALGGLAGAWLRVALTEWVRPGWLPWGTFTVNLIGAALLGWLLPRWRAAARPRHAIPLVAIGGLGSFTTFSALAVEVVVMADGGRAPAGLLYGAGSVAAGVLAATLATRLGERS